MPMRNWSKAPAFGEHFFFEETQKRKRLGVDLGCCPRACSVLLSIHILICLNRIEDYDASHSVKINEYIVHFSSRIKKDALTYLLRLNWNRWLCFCLKLESS